MIARGLFSSIVYKQTTLSSLIETFKDSVIPGLHKPSGSNKLMVDFKGAARKKSKSWCFSKCLFMLMVDLILSWLEHSLSDL